jgi:RNA polymerase sigma factor (TIGR02999 family)
VKADIRLQAKIQAFHAASGGTYGSPRIKIDLEEAGEPVGRHRVARLMREARLQGRPKARFRVVTTDSRHSEPIAPNQLAATPAGKMAMERSGATLQPTALVHETWLRLGGSNQPEWHNRAHFFGAAAEAMRRILIGRARRRNAQRRGAGAVHLDVDAVNLTAPTDDIQILAVDEALQMLATVDPRKAELVKLRYFVGLTIEDAAKTMKISEATANRWWNFARAWLHRELAMSPSRDISLNSADAETTNLR